MRSSSASFGLGSSRRPHATAPARSSGPSSISRSCRGRSARSASRRRTCPGTVPNFSPDGLNDCQIVDAYFSLERLPRTKNKSRTHTVAGGLRTCPGLDARCVQRVCARPDERRARPPIAARGGRAGPDLRILPDLGRQELQSGALRSAPRSRRHLFPRLWGKLHRLYWRFVPGWGFSVSQMPSLRTFSV